MDEPDAQIGAHDLEMEINERAAVVAVQFSWQTTTAQGFLEATQQRLGVGSQPVRGKGNEKGVPILLIKQACRKSNTATTRVSALKLGWCAL
jgi:hypothetical protein